MLIQSLKRGELIVMKIFWKRNSRISRKEIIRLCNEKYSWRKSTTKILLKRLVKKRVLLKRIKFFHIYYIPIVSEKEYIKCKMNNLEPNYLGYFVRLMSTAHKFKNIDEED
ncbi:BlaI/MecI/CopY family transcriptional regulator (plasmid) [Clostridioides difficile]|uniref:BlaI/MecI/CopY family transcriptional regulator n=2 Tax=Clostridioides difficile TaxID=1496 RepID=UPI000BB1E6C8|nr:BlaI/MecI/CopY family transcriptional regulator [Clostridioides difficile]EII6834430.1 BlaI/MecI/CopY family transcriptional regulator [Clostridioides difficile]EIJ0739983.1 BlaI/MecI/CopY family transcriptional regulator [Clostridioides difficile]EJX3465954.1 BlaI/MecI/CopY family transcriptional regulator [Clostridioides difficile]EKS6825718.1 BlaI/MecI/CopY family transcriptional regulator [Clostridioides difficile]MBH7831731.1 BlaI/MecI/CopY family transcriptional regulator [Clostridioi